MKHSWHWAGIPRRSLNSTVSGLAVGWPNTARGLQQSIANKAQAKMKRCQNSSTRLNTVCWRGSPSGTAWTRSRCLPCAGCGRCTLPNDNRGRRDTRGETTSKAPPDPTGGECGSAHRGCHADCVDCSSAVGGEAGRRPPRPTAYPRASNHQARLNLARCRRSTQPAHRPTSPMDKVACRSVPTVLDAGLKPRDHLRKMHDIPKVRRVPSNYCPGQFDRRVTEELLRRQQLPGKADQQPHGGGPLLPLQPPRYDSCIHRPQHSDARCRR